MDDGKTPSAFGTSPKYDMKTFYVNQLSPVVFGGGRVGAGVVARTSFASSNALSLVLQ
jgi:hypothetical protein